MYSLPRLPYAYGALEPYIEAQIMELHHAKHQQAYVDGLNAALEKYPDFFKMPLEDLLKNLAVVPTDIQMAVRNHGGGVWNHTFFWSVMKVNGEGEPVGSVAQAIDEAFGSFGTMKEQFTLLAKNRFGSGWAWLSKDKDKLLIESTPNQDSPIMEGRVPLLGLDVWEHAYYLKYQNKRADYLTAIWNVTNWKEISRRYDEAISKK